MAYSPTYDSTGIDYYTIPAFKFLSGPTLPNIRIAYKSINPSSPKKALIPTCYGGLINSTQTFTNPTEALVTYNVIIVAMLGNGESSSPSNMPHFPHTIDYQDQITSQYALLTNHIGITNLDLVLGFSMAGQQAYYWATMHPRFLKNAVVICSSARTSGHNYAFLEGPKTALQTSTDYAEGAYRANNGGDVVIQPTRGLRAFGRAYCAWLTSGAWYRQRLWETALGYSSLELYMEEWGDNAFQGWDPEDLLILACQWQGGDISEVQGEGYEAALRGIEAKVLVMPSRTDQYFAWEDGEVECGLLRRGELSVIETVWGHEAGGGESEVDSRWVSDRIREFLAQDS